MCIWGVKINYLALKNRRQFVLQGVQRVFVFNALNCCRSSSLNRRQARVKTLCCIVLRQARR